MEVGGSPLILEDAIFEWPALSFGCGNKTIWPGRVVTPSRLAFAPSVQRVLAFCRFHFLPRCSK